MTHNKQPHSFHIPVMGLAYTIDSPIRVAQYGIDSVISIVDDELIEKMHAFYCQKFELPYKEITQKMHDYRADRITGYLNLVDKIVKKKYAAFCAELATSKQALNNFIGILPQMSDIKRGLQFYASSDFDKSNEIRSFVAKHLQPGAIDVNIMTKVDKANYIKNEVLPTQFNDAHAALRGFANSILGSSVVLSAGMNPSLYGYIAEFPDFFPDTNGNLKKKVILKVSDFRSALIQGSFLAKKGIWVSEYRVESGLNCGGHAFATDGLLLGPIMAEFKQRKHELIDTAHGLMVRVLSQKEMPVPKQPLDLKITVQGGVGTAEEHDFLLEEYKVDSVGWGSPFLLVPEATAIDAATRNLLMAAGVEDFYRSDISPLGVPFNTVKGTTNEALKSRRIIDGKAGSSCPKKLLALSREYDKQGICTASRKYQQLRLHELGSLKDILSESDYEDREAAITVKSCLCVGLANPAYLENHIPIKGEAQGVVICPGPNLAYFDKEVSLANMVGHIYGYNSVLSDEYRPNFLIKELQLYVDYFKEELMSGKELTAAQIKKWTTFKNNLLSGIAYYEALFADGKYFTSEIKDFLEKLQYYKQELQANEIPNLEIVV
ncbi:hypothetical protein FMM05_01260 [Flavobacterium zepuense]|uniref:Uncharacterized protein n=1 Tax=Flavobacterium zepuense TaxID=2593302 RepID=A0A552V9Z7_9FLAO|nr:hypothetical protein [Flavobacterium zepuense]TRW27296.1 hypothetical protein FMM05_01260 [Flavobacterium zepuense]